MSRFYSFINVRKYMPNAYLGYEALIENSPALASSSHPPPQKKHERCRSSELRVTSAAFPKLEGNLGRQSPTIHEAS